MIQCAICGKELRPGDAFCQHTELELARYRRDGCACGGDHCGEVTVRGGDECPRCEGTGDRYGRSKVGSVCPDCDGSGSIRGGDDRG